MTRDYGPPLLTDLDSSSVGTLRSREVLDVNGGESVVCLNVNKTGEVN